MIHNFKQFINKIYEGYQVPNDGRTYKKLSSDDLKKIADQRLSSSDMKHPSHDIETTEVEKAPKLKTMPGFKRIIYKDADPKNINAIVYGPLDIVFELDLDNIPVYSKHLESKTKNKNGYGLGKALYYGWSADQYSDQPYFFVTLSINDSNDKPAVNFIPDVPVDEHEMYDLVWQLLDAIDDVNSGKEELLNPIYVTSGRLTDM